MKTIVYIFLLFVNTIAFAQDTTIQSRIDNVNKQLKIYETLQPYGGRFYKVKDLKLTKADLEKEFDQSVKLTDSIENFDAIFIIQDKIEDALHKALTHKNAVNIDFTTVFSDNLYAIKSEDNKLYNFSLDEKSGGSYRSRMSWIYYAEKDEYVLYESFDIHKMKQQDPEPIFEGNGYESIKSFNSKNKMRYLLFGNVRGCGSCYHEYVTLVHFENGDFKLDFSYSIETRTANQKLFFDDTTRVFSISYTTDDLTDDCYCSQEEWYEDVYGGATYDPNRKLDDELETRSCDCYFEFDGETFQLKKRSSVVFKTKD